MSSVRFIAVLLILILATILPPSNVAAGEFHEYASKGKSIPIKLLVWPNEIQAGRKGPVTVYIALVNDADSDVHVRYMLEPTPFIPAQYADLLTHIVDKKTGKEAQFKPPPLPYTFEDTQQREITEDIGIDGIVGRKLDLRSFYALPPGSYKMTMRFDSRYVPSFLRPDKRAWHGQTNSAAVEIRILN